MVVGRSDITSSSAERRRHECSVHGSGNENGAMKPDCRAAECVMVVGCSDGMPCHKTARQMLPYMAARQA